ncbi:uncharacterized protein H6S33_005847 [Morchella sextelata]|uniref:uncharacterized protein n=1 Tax=Morchella sextelata TaxID=1174677 RepID=UPI001D058D4D|nr:uncharacterized protein H6S33_005847 [Morchella sextelata]KAH0613961.1 hypothetical protein H6S33_005847 [Morchella sextelata]
MPPRLRLPTYSLTSLISSSALTPRAAVVSLCREYASKASKNTKTPPRKTKDKKDKKDKRKQRTEFIQWDLKDAQQFSLVEAVRYIRAAEVGHDLVRTKYELAVKLKTPKNGPQLRDRVRLPTPVKTDTRICVIAEGKVAQDALKAGATMAGTDEVFDLIRNGTFDFDLCLCHDKAFQALVKSKVARILGPRGLMPSAKMGTVVKSPTAAISELVGKASYRERLGVVRMPIGQLAFTEQQLQENIKAFMVQLKKDIAGVTQVSKSIAEVVLSSTHGPGFSLSGEITPAKTLA